MDSSDLQSGYSTLGEFKTLNNDNTFTNDLVSDCSGAADLAAPLSSTNKSLLLTVGGTLAAEVVRPEYASRAQVPVTLNLLLHVLAKEGVAGAVLSRSRLYDRAVRMMVQASAFRGRLQGEERVAWTLDTLRSVAFWN